VGAEVFVEHTADEFVLGHLYLAFKEKERIVCALFWYQNHALMVTVVGAHYKRVCEIGLNVCIQKLASSEEIWPERNFEWIARNFEVDVFRENSHFRKKYWEGQDCILE